MTNSEVASQVIGSLPEEWTWGDLLTAITVALEEAELRGEDTKEAEWEAWHLETFGHTITKRAGNVG